MKVDEVYVKKKSVMLCFGDLTYQQSEGRIESRLKQEKVVWGRVFQVYTFKNIILRHQHFVNSERMLLFL